MKPFLLLLSAVTLSLFAQSADTAVFVAAMSPANEVPAITGYEASGTGVLYAHAVRNAQGQIVSGSVDFVILHTFPDLPTVTGLHIHNGPAGQNAGVVINTGIGAGPASVTVTAGRGIIERQAQVAATDANGLAALRGLFDNPQGYYVNLHTTVYPGGIIRGQLHRAERAIFMGRMLPGNEVPAITDFNGTALGTVEAVRGYDANGRYVAGALTFNVDYTVPETTTFTGLHIHNGPAGANAGVVINSGLGAGAASVEAAAGSGNITRRVEIPLVSPATAFIALEGLFDNPAGHYINIHSTRFPGGVMRSQMFRTEVLRLPVNMLPSNEVPPITGLEASSVGNFWIHALRDRTGAVTAANVTFDINHRFPGETRFTGLHIHDGKAGANGGVTINSGLRAFDSLTGNGNIFASMNVSGGQALMSLNSLLATPDNHYINLHTSVHAGGAVRMQMGSETTATPAITHAFSAVSDPRVANIAPAGQFTIFGNNLVRTGTVFGGIVGDRQPTAANGTSVTVGGMDAPLIALGVIPGGNPNSYIVALTPTGLANGEHPIVVKTGVGSSAARPITVAAQAPAVFFDAEGAIVIRASNLEQVNPGNAAVAGEALALISTGLGQTSPALANGEIVSDARMVTTPVSITVGGQNATVLGTAVIPGLPGVYATVFQMPQGVARGNADVILRINNIASNTTTIPVR